MLREQDSEQNRFAMTFTRALIKLLISLLRRCQGSRVNCRSARSVKFEAIPDLAKDSIVDRHIVKTKVLELMPMDEKEAALEMEMIDHDFFVFLNDKTNKVNVVYKRKDGNYGLLETKH